MTRVCFVTVEFHGLFKNGGIGTANTALAVALAESGFDVTVAVANSDESGPRLKVGDFAELKAHWASRGITLDYVRPHPHIAGSFDDPRTASYCVFLYLQSGDFDVVLFNDNGGQGYYSLLAKHTGVFERPPLMLVVAHGPIDWVHELNALEYYSRMPVVMSYLERRSAALADLLVSPSRYLLEWMVTRGWVAPERGQVVQNLLGVESSYPDAPARTEHQDFTEIVFFGRQETRKGVTLFCDALDLLARTTDLRSKRITFLGKFGRIGALHSGVYLAERARKWPASLRVLATYDQAEALSYLGRPSVLAVIPSLAENSPCVVAECLQLGVPFLATDSGGTAELVAPEDRELCLFPHDAMALARRLEEMLRSGQPRRARLAVSPEDTRAQWIRLLDTAVATSTGNTPEQGDLPLVSICLAGSKSRRFQSCLDSLVRQAYERFEIIVAVDPDDAPDPRLLDESGVTVVSGAFAGVGAARNAAATRAKGDYLLFVEEAAATLLPGALAVLVGAARRTAADIVTGFRQVDASQKVPKPGAREWELPIGACAELGTVENCYGEAALLVESTHFRSRRGFAPEAFGNILDWLFLAGAVLDGAALEVIPVPVVSLRERLGAMDDGERTVVDHRRIFALYKDAPAQIVARLAECNLRVGAQNQQKMQRSLQQLNKPARDIALRLGSVEASSTEASRLFVQYCCERRLVDLALDFALHNDAPFLPDTITAMSRVNEADAHSLIQTRRFNLRHIIDLSGPAQARARAFFGLGATDLQRPPEGGLGHAVQPGDCIIKIPGACPPGVLAVRATALADSALPLRLACVVCRAGARPVLSDTGIAPDKSVWWSGWIELDGTAAPGELVVELPQPAAELFDLYLIARREQAEPFASATVTWKEITAEVCLTGDLTPSAIERAIDATPLPAEWVARGELLADTTGIPFPVFVPGVRTLLHPLAGRLSFIRVAGGLPRGARGLRCLVSVEHEKAHPIEFGVWAREASTTALGATELGEVENFSGWLRIDQPLKKCNFTLLLPAPAADPMDLYLATRVVDANDAYFCHAYWHEFAILEDVGAHGVSLRSVPGHTADVLPMPPPGVVRGRAFAAARTARAPRSSYLLCAGARTGSNLLASALRRTGVCGMPFEYFNADLMNDETILRELGVSAGAVDVGALAGRLEAILRTGTTSNEVFGATVHWWDLERLYSALGKQMGRELAPLGAAPEGLRSFFPDLRFVWLRRENKVAQGISHYLARKSGAWHRWVREVPTRQSSAAEVPYDLEAIRECVTTAEAEEAGWTHFLAGCAERTLTLTYEELAADYPRTVTRVLAFMGLSLPEREIPIPAFHRQANARSLEWEQRYRAETQGVVALSGAQSA